MAYVEQELELLVQQAQQRAQRARTRAILYSLIPVVLAVLLLGFVGWQLERAGRELASVSAQLSKSQDELDALDLELSRTERLLGATSQDLDEAQRELVMARKQLAVTEGQLSATQSELTATRATLADTEQELAETKQKLAAAQERLEQLERGLDELAKTSESYRAEIADLEQQRAELVQELRDTNEQLKLATDLNQYRFTGDWPLTIKLMASNYIYYGLPGDFVSTLYYLQDAEWKLGGFSPGEGFDSPSFVAYILDSYGLLDAPAIDVRYGLDRVLPAREGLPEVGDIVFYEAGYTMFYLVDEEGQPFVLGMTPVGVLALEPDFAPVKSYGIAFGQ